MLDRRNFLKTAASFTAAGLVSRAFGEEAEAPKPAFKAGKARHVIQIWMWGGPSSLETFDPKPGAGPAYCGSLDHPLQTNVPVIEISQTLPNLAQCADLYACIRTMTHETNHHEIAAYRMQTGRMPG
ncbi:MAG: DUF1501 domain-containing protein, partial [Thermoguttaceae bacterium]|nr:DUF1501 domain-containing protein [Thermoguttaceae bacterium]